MRQLRSGRMLSVVLLLWPTGPQPQADVWEYSPDGSIVVSPDRMWAGHAGNKPGSAPAPLAPQFYRDMTRAVALQYSTRAGVQRAGLSAGGFEAVFTALIDQESRFNPRARSPKGAQGLGQLMPGTARALGVSDPYEPQANLHGAARYFLAQVDRFGRVDLALAAYNAGPHRIEQYGGIPPFRETRNYVARIMAAAGLSAPTARINTASTPSPSTNLQRTVQEWIN